jgi:hypothetical protein
MVGGKTFISAQKGLNLGVRTLAIVMVFLSIKSSVSAQGAVAP